MDSFELNKIIGAILGTLLFVMGAGFLAEAIYEPIEGPGPGYELPEPEGEGAHGPVEEPAMVDVGTLLAAANPAQGQATASSRCASCHNFAEGTGNKQGPELWDVVARTIASHAGFNYSNALAAHSSDTWTYENLNAFLLAPQAFAPGTKMNFGGLKNDQDRANVLAYLATLSASPVPFPPPAPTGEAAAEPILTTGDAVETPTETQSERTVEGTSTSGAIEPAPAVEDPAVAPATEAPVLAPGTDAPGMEIPAEGSAAPAGEMTAPAN
jgi:cytochrome c